MYSGSPDLYNAVKYPPAPVTSSSVMVSSSYGASDDQLVPNNLYTYSPAVQSNLSQAGYADLPLIDYAPAVNHQVPAYSHGGFIPPVIDPMPSGPIMCGPQSDPWAYGARGSVVNINPSKIPPNPPRKGGRKPKTNKLPPAEEEKRRVRRLRNKLAAAKCRQRRLDHTQILLAETEQLEEEQNRIESEVIRLKQIKEHYEYILRTHKPMCRKNSPPNSNGKGPTPVSMAANVGTSHNRNLSLQTCAALHRKSSSSDSDLHSPLLAL